MRRRSFVAMLTGGVLGATLPGRIGAGELHAANQNGLITLNDYEFIPPQGWVVQRNAADVTMRNLSSCIIQLNAPTSLPGSLQEVCLAVFQKMYAGWQLRQTGERQYLLSTGVLRKGLEYFMMEAEVKKEGGEFGGIMDGTALIVKAGSQLAVIAALHASLIPGHRECWVNYATWRRFFNSFTVRNAPIATGSQGDLSKRIVGRWMMTEGLAVGEYVFAANGTYTSDGTIGGDPERGRIADTSRNSLYSITGDQLVLTTPRGTKEQVRLRFERVNHGGTGWRERVFMLKRDAYGENEVAYERQ
jgi:hypothetical protein